MDVLELVFTDLLQITILKWVQIYDFSILT